MRTIRSLQEHEFSDFTAIGQLAYPVIFKDFGPEKLEEMAQSMWIRHSENPTVTYYGAFDGDELVGGMRIHTFSMNVFGQMLPTLGVGMVAVSLAHKKQRVAYDLLQFFLYQAKQKGALFTILYPFRPDFYKQMGFGYGTEKHAYRIRPGHFPQHDPEGEIRIITDFEPVKACYERLLPKTHGLVALTPGDLENLLKTSGKNLIGYFREGECKGFLEAIFLPTNPSSMVRQDMRVSTLFYEDREAFLSLMEFLRRQLDQVDRIEFLTYEEDFHFLPFDPRDDTLDMLYELYQVSHRSGVGLMYRVMDVSAVFKALADHNFGCQTLTLMLDVTDSFYPAAQGQFIISFKDGKAEVVEGIKPDVAIGLDISDLTSLLLGVIDFRQLYKFGLADIDNMDYFDQVQALFYSPIKPVCITQF